MLVGDFDYCLPEELIAQDPLEDRSSSRLLYLDKKTGKVSHHTFKDILTFLKKGDTLVLNDTKVIPARLYGKRKDTGSKIEILLLKRISKDSWECLVRPGKKCREGHEFIFEDKGLGVCLEGRISKVLGDGNRIIDFSYEGVFEEVLDRVGQMPLPPYIKHELKDKDRYQTVYARYDGSAAAPTAGELLDGALRMGVNIAGVTLHVGLGTFRPVKEDNVEDHLMHSEHFSISEEAADVINHTRDNGGRVICVGTTSVRTLESAASCDGKISPMEGDTQIFIYPGYEFKAVDGIITNFHLPKSTLIMLVSAFAGRENVLRAYEEAVRERYRFFSFGDACVIL